MVSGHLKTKYHEKAVLAYDNDGSDQINVWLRSDSCDPDNPVVSYRDHHGLKAWECDEVTGILNIDEAISNNAAQEDCTLWRGLNPKSTLFEAENLKPGDEICDPAYLSATTTQGYAASYCPDGCYMLRIKVRAGQNMIRVSDHLVESKDHIIMPRETTMQVTAVDADRKIVSVEVI